MLVASLCGRSCAGCSCLAISERAATRRAVRRALSVASPAQGLLPFTPGTNLRAWEGRRARHPDWTAAATGLAVGARTRWVARHSHRAEIATGALAAAELAVPARFWPSVKPWLTVTEGDEPRVPPEGICTSARLAQAQEAVKNRESHVSRAPAAPAFPSAAITEAVSAPPICGGGGRRRATRSAGLNRHCGVRTGPGGSGRGNGNRRRPTRSGRQAAATGDGG